jgi:hypothetical protein
MQRVRFSARSLPFALALTTILAYGLLLPSTGFYWDDWPFAWIARFLGPAEFVPAFQGFRPFLGPIFYLTTSLLPSNPALWQATALVVHFLAAWAVWWCLNQVWPANQQLTVSTALLFLVFPGYSQHWVAFTHINQEWLSLIAYVLSFGLSVRALRRPATALWVTVLALTLQVVGLLPTEYFATMEPLRALLFWTVLSTSFPARGERARAVLRAWSPYLVVWLINGIWLVYFYASGAYISYDLTAAAAPPAAADVLRVFGDALLKAGAYVWLQVIPLTFAASSAPTSMLAWVIILIAFLALVFYLGHLQPAHALQTHQKGATERIRVEAARSRVICGRQAIMIGIIGVLLGRIPSFVAGLPLTLQSSFDRLTISMMLGAALLVAGALQVLVSRAAIRTYLLAALVALGVGQQFFNANIFRRDWQRQQDIYWQLAWRMPGIQPDTAILTQQMPLDYETDLAMTAALNWMYAPNVEPPHLPLALVYTEKRLGGVVLPALEPDLPMLMPLRTMTFHGNTSNVIAVHVPALGCLRVFDPALNDAWTYSRLPEVVTAAIPLSDPGRIIADAGPLVLPSPPFSAEPEHGWCYIYEKAELARQMRQWGEVNQLRQLAAEARLEPDDPFEWLPFIEAEAQAGDIKWARGESLDLAGREPKMQRGLCALWSRVEQTGSHEVEAASASVRLDLACK